MKYLIDILKGVVIGVANAIPGVSGGTMMVSMGIYEDGRYLLAYEFCTVVGTHDDGNAGLFFHIL